jgi:hypothetical protein
VTFAKPAPPAAPPADLPALAPTPPVGDTGVVLSVVLLTALFGVNLAWILVSSSVAELRFAALWTYALARAVEYGLFAVVLALVGRSPVRRVAAAALGLLAGAIVVAWTLGLPRLATSNDGPHRVEVIGWMIALAMPVLLVVAWGVARRLGQLWLVALPLAAGLGAAAYQAFELVLAAHVTWIPEHLMWIQLLSLVATWVPVVLAGLAAWSLDALQRRP